VKWQLQTGEIPDLTAVECTGETAARKMVIKYQQLSRWRRTWQIAHSFPPYAALWYLICFAVDRVAAGNTGGRMSGAVIHDSTFRLYA
jgi:hypothetical protein